MNTIKEKTPFQINEFAAADKLAAEMEQFGLEVARNCFSGRYENGTLDLYNVTVRTKSYPVKGNKKLIEDLEAHGYYVQKCMATAPAGTRRKTCRSARSAPAAPRRGRRLAGIWATLRNIST